MLAVTNVVRFTGETIYTVRDTDTHHTVAVVTADGFFDRHRFWGHVQDPQRAHSLTGDVREQALSAVETYLRRPW